METPEFEYIGPYRVVRTLGQGGMGTVYHGVNNKTNDPVAIKVISAGMAQHQRFRRRFDNSARYSGQNRASQEFVAHQLSARHRNICRAEMLLCR